ncbi:MAG: hypothetical protein DHS20C18_43750 [Saprospiraceae bacterium]|nr:MAG: hypothetical protein DHS20C18_43750 [Saprospiraceae bacterium]
MKNDNKIKANLEEQFKQLIPDENAPEELKKEVFNTIDTLNLLGDIADLFTSKFTQTKATFLDLTQNDDSEEQ